jgi:hypothetical protein
MRRSPAPLDPAALVLATIAVFAAGCASPGSRNGAAAPSSHDLAVRCDGGDLGACEGMAYARAFGRIPGDRELALARPRPVCGGATLAACTPRADVLAEGTPDAPADASPAVREAAKAAPSPTETDDGASLRARRGTPAR